MIVEVGGAFAGLPISIHSPENGSYSDRQAVQRNSARAINESPSLENACRAENSL